MDVTSFAAVEHEMTQYEWYHTIELAPGLLTPGFYDHRPYLGAYGLPRKLDGLTALDVGAANGFFTFELEKRGAQVTSTELPTWLSHDFGPRYQPDMTPDRAESYLHGSYLFAQKVLNSKAHRKLIALDDISPETTGMFDLVFCGSVLLHVTDPIRALWHLRSVTRQVAIIATVIHPLPTTEPLAQFVGRQTGDVWWLPNRAAFEDMIASAGFTGWEWFSEFRMDFRDGRTGPYHGVIRAWTTRDRPAILDETDLPPPNLVRQTARIEDPQIRELQDLVRTYENRKVVRLADWLETLRRRLRSR